jgi:hypothetical protein
MLLCLIRKLILLGHSQTECRTALTRYQYQEWAIPARAKNANEILASSTLFCMKTGAQMGRKDLEIVVGVPSGLDVLS